MSDRQLHRILGIAYFDPEDPRVLVPRRDRLGWYLNFGHPSSVTVVSWLCGVYLLALVVIPFVAHPQLVSRAPQDIVWWALAVLTAAAMVRFNRCVACSDYRRIALAAFGVLAGIGFSVQFLINKPLMLWWGDHLSWPHHLLLASVAAAAQTFGKWFALSILLKARPATSCSQYLRSGVMVGLGFTILEITLLYFGAAWRLVPLDYLGLWERASASLFHVYSAGVVAIAIGARRYRFILVVFALHAFMDFLAGAGGTFGISLYGLESLFSSIGIVMWVICLLAVRYCQGADG
jgi:hypothetical protein